ncbi:hypothetical protein KBC04_04130 [Candidatus Babeliales bacterium]|nr:hypothetical protein [Candidatus Babeliales bacterium]MBP9843315.1 hypothetical protein [Candidatus Babeliales bacterium]
MIFSKKTVFMLALFFNANCYSSNRVVPSNQTLEEINQEVGEENRLLYLQIIQNQVTKENRRLYRESIHDQVAEENRRLYREIVRDQIQSNSSVKSTGATYLSSLNSVRSQAQQESTPGCFSFLFGRKRNANIHP